MAQPNAPLKAALATLDNLPGVTPADVRRITALIVDNPVLLDGFNRAAASGALKSFAADTDPWSTASFGAGVMRLQVDDLLPTPRGSYDAMALTFTLAHEIAHANDPRLAGALAQFTRDADAVANSPSRVHDYTPAITRYLDARRDSEGQATLAGFNAVHAALVAQGIAPTVANMYTASPRDMDLFLDPTNPSRWNPGLRFDAGGALQNVAGNLPLLNHLYFHGGGSDADFVGGVNYSHAYARLPLAYALHVDRNAVQQTGREPARVVVDFQFLGLDEDKMPPVYVYPPVRVYDRPTDPSPSRRYGPRPNSLHVPDGGDAPEPGLLAQARAAVERLDGTLARTPDGASARLAASMAALAQAHGFERIDHVMASHAAAGQPAGATAFVVQGQPGDGRARTARMPMDEALQAGTPARLLQAALPTSTTPDAPARAMQPVA